MAETPSRERRNSVILYAAVRRDGHEPAECRVRNLSSTGACVDNDAGLIVGQPVTVDMGGLRKLPANVIWVERAFAGLRFGVPVDLAAARRPRSKGPVSAHAGWIDNLSNAYRRQG